MVLFLLPRMGRMTRMGEGEAGWDSSFVRFVSFVVTKRALSKCLPVSSGEGWCFFFYHEWDE